MDELLLSKEELENFEILDGRYEGKIECSEDLYWFNRFFRNYLVVNLEGREVPDDRFLIRIYLFLAGENFRKVVLSRGMEFSSYLEVAEMADKLFRINSFEELYQVEEIELFDRVDTFEIFNTEIKMERIEKVSECAKKFYFQCVKRKFSFRSQLHFYFVKTFSKQR